MPTTIVVPPAELPVTLDELKAQTNIDSDISDALLMGYLRAAVGYVERVYDMPLVTQTLDVDVVAFPAAGKPLNVRQWPLQSVTSIVYVDSAAAEAIWDAGAYRVIAGQGLIWPAVGGSYPTALDTVVVRGVFGFGGRNDVPPEIRHALMLIVADWSRDRENTVTGAALQPIPIGAKNLLMSYRRNWIA